MDSIASFVRRARRPFARARALGLTALLLVSAASIAGAQTQTPAPPPEAPPRPAAFRIENAATGSSLRIRGFLQADGAFFPEDKEGDNSDGFLLKRIRFRLDGILFRHYEYRFQTELRNNVVDVLDAWLEAKPSDAFRIRIGKGKAPVSLDRLQSPTDQPAYERSYPTQFAPNRDIGAQVLGDVHQGVVSYAMGLFDGTPDGASVIANTDHSVEVNGRLFVLPFGSRARSPLRGLGLGAAFTHGSVDGSTANTGLSQYKTIGGATIFRYVSAAVADGDRDRADLQGYYYAGRLGILSEWIRSAQDIRLADAVTTVAHRAWSTGVSFALTHDHPTYAGLVPRTQLSRAAGTVGGLELAARLHGAAFDEAAFGAGLASDTASVRKALAWTLGLNWYLNPNARVTVDFERTRFRGGALTGDRASENAILTRFQLVI